MRKSSFLLILSFVLPCFFSCDFAIPTAIEITGTPSFRFAETVNVGKMFTDLFDESMTDNEKISFFPCKKTETLTYLIHMDLFSEKFDVEEDDPNNIKLPDFPGIEFDTSHLGIKLDEDKTLIDSSKDRVVLPLSEIGSLLKDFSFSEYKTLLYISGSEILKKAKIDINIEKVEIENGIEKNILVKMEKNVDINNKPSKIDKWEKEGYNDKSYPDDGGIDAEIPITNKDIAVSFKVYFPKGETIMLDDFQDGNIKLEIVVWLPFVFTAKEDGAEIKFPEDSFLSSEDDLFGRDEPGADSKIIDIIESLSVDIKFQKNPFVGAELIVFSKGVTIKNPVSSNTLSFKVKEEHMEQINDPANYPFTPNIKISFKKDDKLIFPRVFNVVEFGFKAKIRYRIDFQE